MSLASKIQSLIDAGNETTGESSTDLTGVMQDLIDGYGGGVTRYTVTYSLTNVTSSNTASRIADGSSYTTTLTPSTGLTMENVIVTMGSTDITSTAYSNGVVTIASVTGAVSITASAAQYVDNITIDDVDSTLRTATQSVVTSINNSASNSISFVILTDTHGSANGQKSQNAVRYILKNSLANKLFWLGDMSNANWSTSEYETFREPLLNCADKVYPTLGNHEYFGNASGTGLDEIYTDFLEEKTLSGAPSSFYYYFDDSAKKVRYIMLNTSEGATDNVSSTQLTWLSSAVTLPTNEWGIVVLSHYPFDRTLGSTGQGVQLYTSYWESICDILETTNGTIISHLCGHIHADSQAVLDYTFYEQRLLNDSASGQAINVVNINLTTGVAHIYRIGSGQDIEYTYTNVPAMVTRTVTNTLTGCTTSNAKTSIINGRPYTATLTPETNYDLDTGTVTVTMGGTDITSTAYNSSTHVISIGTVSGNVSITATATYVEPIAEYEPSWLIRDTTAVNPSLTFTSTDAVASGFPDYMSILMCNGSTAFGTGYRTGSSAKFCARKGYTNTYCSFKSDVPGAITAVTVDGLKWAYITFTKTEITDAYATYTTAINDGASEYLAQAGIGLLNMTGDKVSADLEYWIIAQNVDSSNVADIIRRLPAHTSE